MFLFIILLYLFISEGNMDEVIFYQWQMNVQSTGL